MTDIAGALESAWRLASEGRTGEAIAVYDRLLAANPGLADAHFNRAFLLQTQGRFEAAEIGFEAALKARPGWPQPLFALGHLAFHLRDFARAEGWFERAAALAPDSADAACNLGIARLRQMHPARALPALQRARQLAPSSEIAWFELRRALTLLGRHAEAQQDFLAFERAAAPSPRVIATGLYTSRRVPGSPLEQRYLPLALQWTYTAGDLEALSDILGLLPYFDAPREAAYALYQAYDRLAQETRRGHADLARAPGGSGGALRIGYLSADLRTHVMGRIIEAILERHDSAGFDARLYSLLPATGEDALTARLAARASGFTRLSGLSDVEAANAIADDRLHVLVDLMGHTAWAQPGILLYKPAPVIVTHLGCHGALGLRQVDWKITDAVADLPDAGDFQIERPLPMAGSVIPLRRVADVPPGTRVAGDAPVFGAFTGLRKLGARCLLAWARILAAVPEARLLFSPQREDERELLLQRAASFGIRPERVVFVPMTLGEAQDRARYAAVDVALDAFPYTGGDSAACAMAEGVPLVTLLGTRHAERVAASVLTHLGVTDTIARSEDEYVALAVRLARDRTWRDALAARIRAALPGREEALVAYTRSLEAALREAWDRHAAGKGAHTQ